MMMGHPDAAFSPYYCAPAGQPDDPCNHSGDRLRVGPTSRKKTFMLLVDQCRCGRILRSAEDLSWEEYDWVRRLNKGRKQ